MEPRSNHVALGAVAIDEKLARNQRGQQESAPIMHRPHNQPGRFELAPQQRLVVAAKMSGRDVVARVKPLAGRHVDEDMAARLQVIERGFEKRLGLINVLDDIEEDQKVIAFSQSGMAVVDIVIEDAMRRGMQRQGGLVEIAAIRSPGGLRGELPPDRAVAAADIEPRHRGSRIKAETANLAQEEREA